MTQIEHILCAFCGGLFGWSIVYAWCKIWDFVTRKRVEIPDIKYDVTDNPILQLKNRLGQAYVASHDQTVKKLLHRLLEYVKVIDEWHKEEINDCNRTQEGLRTHCKKFSQQCDRYRAEVDEWAKRCTELQSKLDEAQAQLKATEQAIRKHTSAIIHIDSEDLNRYSVGRGPDGNLLKDEPPIKNEEFLKQLRDWWGLEAQKAVELPKDEPPIYSEEFNKKLREIWFGVDNDTECHQYSVTVRKYGDCNEKKIVVLARSPIEASKLVPSGYTVENISKLFE